MRGTGGTRKLTTLSFGQILYLEAENGLNHSVQVRERVTTMFDRLFSLTRLQLLERPVGVDITGGEARANVDWKIADARDIDDLSEAGIQYHDGRKRFAKQMPPLLCGG